MPRARQHGLLSLCSRSFPLRGVQIIRVNWSSFSSRGHATWSLMLGLPFNATIRVPNPNPHAWACTYGTSHASSAPCYAPCWCPSLLSTMFSFPLRGVEVIRVYWSSASHQCTYAAERTDLGGHHATYITCCASCWRCSLPSRTSLLLRSEGFREYKHFQESSAAMGYNAGTTAWDHSLGPQPAAQLS